MTKLKIAHIKDHGVNVIIVPLASRFGTLTVAEKDQVITTLQDRAMALLLNGRVVPVWEQGRSMRFIAPEQWHRFFARLRMSTIRANLNRELDFDDTQTTAQDNAQQNEAAVADMRALLAQLDPREKWPHELPKPSLPVRIARWFGFGT